MIRLNRVQLRIGVSVILAGAALCISAGARTTDAPSICTRLVAQMRRSPTTVIKDWREPTRADSLWYGPWRPWITVTKFGVSSDSGAFRRVDSKWATRFKGPFAPGVRSVDALPGTGLFVGSAILGSGHCLTTLFVEWKWGKRLRVIPRPQLPLPLCELENNPSWANPAMVLGEPAYVGSRALNGSDAGQLMFIARWSGNRWTRPCPVSIRFTYRYAVTLLYCGTSSGVCNAARRLIPEVFRRYGAYETSVFDAMNDRTPVPKFHFRGVPGTRERLLLARARRIGLPKRIAPGSGAPPVWLRHLNPADVEYFPLRVDGKEYVGAADYRAYPWPWPNPVFLVFRAPRASARRLVPLAAFAAHSLASGIKSIQARNESPSSSGGS